MAEGWGAQVRGAFWLALKVVPVFVILGSGVGWLFGVENGEFPVARFVLGALSPVAAGVLMGVLVLLAPGVYGGGRLGRVAVFTLPLVFLALVWLGQVFVGDPFGGLTGLDRFPGRNWAGWMPSALFFVLAAGFCEGLRRGDRGVGAVD